ncbi:MAG: hypothetical protein ABI382_10415 [Nakamurella sp.]
MTPDIEPGRGLVTPTSAYSYQETVELLLGEIHRRSQQGRVSNQTKLGGS